MPIGNISKIVAIWQRLRRLSPFQWSMKRRPSGTCHMPSLLASCNTWPQIVLIYCCYCCNCCSNMPHHFRLINHWSIFIFISQVASFLALSNYCGLTCPSTPAQDESQMKIFYRFLGHNKRSNRKKTKWNLGENQTELIYSWKNNFERKFSGREYM